MVLIAARCERLPRTYRAVRLNLFHPVVDIATLTLTTTHRYGFEMETFEFLNVLQTHGFPKVMGVLTHLDHFKARSSRFQHTIYAREECFCFVIDIWCWRLDPGISSYV